MVFRTEVDKPAARPHGPSAWSKRRTTSSPKRIFRGARGFAAELTDALDPRLQQTVHDLGAGPQGSDGSSAIAAT